MRIGPLMASTAGRVEQLSDLPDASAASAACLAALSDLLQRAGPPPRFFEDGPARDALTETYDHRLKLRPRAKMKTALKVIFITFFVLLPEPRAGKATDVFDSTRDAQNAHSPL